MSVPINGSGLEFGPLDFMGEIHGTSDPYFLQALGEGSTLGNPIPVEKTLPSQLLDGNIVEITSYDNRELLVLVMIGAPDSAALALGEKALRMECAKRTTLKWTPPDGYGATTVYEVVTSKLEWRFDDFQERKLRRYYTLTLKAAPFGRSVDEVVNPALTAGATLVTATISDGTSATGWTSTHGPVTSSGGALQLVGDTAGNLNAQYSGLGGVSFATTPYLEFTLDAGGSVLDGPGVPTVYVDGVLALLLSYEYVGPRKMRYVCLVSDTSATTLSIFTTTSYLPTYEGAVAELALDDVKRTNQPPAGSSVKQSLRTVSVTGSERTQATLSIASPDPTKGLGLSLVYTAASMTSAPNLRPRRVSGGTQTVDIATLSGVRETMDADIVFDVPAGPLRRGGHLPMILVRSTVGTHTKTFGWSAVTRIGTTSLAGQTGASEPVALNTSTWTLVPLGAATLPPTDVDLGSSATVRVTVQAAANTEWDEALLFYYGDDAALSIVNCGQGVPSPGTVHNHLWLEPATIDRDKPSIRVGTLADGTDRFHAGALATTWEAHPMPAGDVTIWVATTGVGNPLVEARHYPRWFGNAAS